MTASAEHAEAWEKVVKKLRTTSMPPAGAPRPDEATYVAVASAIESALDRAAAARPQVGTLPLAHRLSRTEYRNAVRDLLALGDLPRELSIDYLLPADNISSGFDTIADLLFVSPSAMERYLDAAQKISRLAVGDTTMPVLVNIHPLDPEHPQDERVDELPFGTRGGLAVRSDVPVNGTYVVKVELAGNPREPHQLEVTVDGARVRLEPVGGAPGGGRGGTRRSAGARFPLRVSAVARGRPAADRRRVSAADGGPRRSHAASAHAKPRDAAGDRVGDDQRPAHAPPRPAIRPAGGASSSAGPRPPRTKCRVPPASCRRWRGAPTGVR